MKKNIMKNFVVLMLFLLLPLIGFAEDLGPKQKVFGVGIIVGDPTGVTVKGYLADRLALSGIASWSFVDEAFTLIGDVTYELFDIATTSPAITLPFYLGGGGKLAFDEGGSNDGKTLFGVRIPVGVAVQWVNAPVEVFLELGPGIELIPETEFDITGGLGIRYYF